MNPAELERLTVLCIGQVTHDRYDNELVSGGCAYFAARTAHALGARVRLLTSVGLDFSRDEDLADLETRVMRSGKTTVFTNLYPEGSDRVQMVDALAPPISLGTLAPEWAHADVLLLAPVLGEINPQEDWLGTVDARVRSVCLQGFLKRAGEDGLVRPRRPGPRFVNFRPDACFLSEEDLRYAENGFLDYLKTCCPRVFVTRGDKGCALHLPGRTVPIGVFAARPVDPTGAGDTFACACSLALATGTEPETAARFAAAAASIVVEFEGSRRMDLVQNTMFRFLNP